MAGALAAGGAAIGVAVVRRTSREGSMPQRQDGGYVTIRSVTIDRSAQQVRQLCRDTDRLSVCFDRAVVLEQLGEDRWRYRVDEASHRDRASGARKPVEAVVRGTGNLFSWQVEDGPARHEGRMLLTAAPGDRGTEVRVELRYPGTRLGRLAAAARGRDADQALRTLLRRVKSVLECGQVVSTMDDPSGRGPVAERVTRTMRQKLATGGRP